MTTDTLQFGEGIYTDAELPAGMEWYDELGGSATGWVCDPNGRGWWHVSELEPSNTTPSPGVLPGEGAE